MLDSRDAQADAIVVTMVVMMRDEKGKLKMLRGLL